MTLFVASSPKLSQSDARARDVDSSESVVPSLTRRDGAFLAQLIKFAADKFARLGLKFKPDEFERCLRRQVS
jgi:hypothetical protein